LSERTDVPRSSIDVPRAAAAAACAALSPAAEGWNARLHLEFERAGARTVLAARSHLGPLRVQKALYPEGPGVCQAIIVHPPGGIVGGDTLAIDIDAGAGAHAQLTTPGASKWYRSASVPANAVTTLRAGPRALLEWLPQESILFDGARASIALRVELASDARFFGWEVICLGRTAANERFVRGSLRQSFDLLRDGAPAFSERAAINGGDRALQSGAILNGAPVFGTLVAAGATIPDDLVAACRAVTCASGDGATTRLPGVLVARYRGDSASAARAYFANLWRLLRPSLAGRDAVMPRIFAT
jgi:urease accessory protein